MYNKLLLITTITIVSILCIEVFDAYAQESNSIEGTVVDAETLQSILELM